MHRLVLGMLFLLSMNPASGPAAEIRIDDATRHQTIEGFGGFGGKRTWWSGDDPSLYFDERWIRSLIEDLGVSLLRDAVPPCFEDPNDNADPNTLDLSAIDLDTKPYGDHKFSTHVPYWKALKQAGLQKLIVSVWTPPRWMKDNGSHISGKLIPGMDEELAERYVAFVRLLKQHSGIDLYGLSIQNEPAFQEPYESCVYSPAEYRKLLSVVGRRLAAEGLSVKLFGPEDVIGRGDAMFQYVDEVCSDAEACRHFAAVAVHGYGADGASPSSVSARLWTDLKALAKKHGKLLWMTETQGAAPNDGGWKNAWATVQGIYAGLTYGDLSAFAWWYLENEFFDNNFAPTKLFHACKQFYRYVRPGAVRIQALSDDSGLYSVAFLHPKSRILTAVILNATTGEKSATVKLGGSIAPTSLHGFRTSLAEDHADLGTIAVSGPIPFPPQSITTLVSAVPALDAETGAGENSGGTNSPGGGSSVAPSPQPDASSPTGEAGGAAPEGAQGSPGAGCGCGSGPRHPVGLLGLALLLVCWTIRRRNARGRGVGSGLFLWLAFGAVGSQPAQARTVEVSTAQSLVQALQDATAGDEIVLRDGAYTLDGVTLQTFQAMYRDALVGDLRKKGDLDILLDKGQPISGLTDDYCARARGATLDLGALQHSLGDCETIRPPQSGGSTTPPSGGGNAGDGNSPPDSNGSPSGDPQPGIGQPPGEIDPANPEAGTVTELADAGNVDGASSGCGCRSQGGPAPLDACIWMIPLVLWIRWRDPRRRAASEPGSRGGASPGSAPGPTPWRPKSPG